MFCGNHLHNRPLVDSGSFDYLRYSFDIDYCIDVLLTEKVIEIGTELVRAENIRWQREGGENWSMKPIWVRNKDLSVRSIGRGT